MIFYADLNRIGNNYYIVTLRTCYFYKFSVHLKESAPIRTLEELLVRASITKTKTVWLHKETPSSILQVGYVYHKIL